MPGLTNENAYSGDISYIVRSPRIKGRATLYYARISDQIWSRSFMAHFSVALPVT